MSTRLWFGSLWDDLRSSLWFRPLVITLSSALLAAITVTIDYQVEVPEFFVTSADNARAELSAIASSMLTVTTLTFSIMVVALVLASQQFSPRILRKFMSDPVKQNLIGFFIGTFVYTLLVLNRIDDASDPPFVPVVSVAFSLLLSFLSVGAFIYFIHHFAKSIQISSIVAGIREETEDLLEKSFSAPVRVFPAEIPQLSAENAVSIPAPRSGYIQGIDLEELVNIAQEHEVVMQVERLMGEFVARDTRLMLVQPRANEKLTAAVYRAFDFGDERTLYQDSLFGIRQLEDIAIKAISPAINDPTTAINCLDHICSLLVFVAQHPDASPYHSDSAGQVRIIARKPAFSDFVNQSFNQIRQYAASEVAVSLRMIEVLIEVAQIVQEHERQQVLWRHAGMIARGADRGIGEPYDRQKVNQRLEQLAALTGQPAQEILLAEKN